MVPSSYNCTHACDFSRGNTHFYNVSEVQIHAWFRPTVTHGSQRGYKYDNMWVAKVHAWVVLITTGVLYVLTTREYTVIITQACAVATTSTSTKHTGDCYIVTIMIVMLYYCMCCNTCTVTHVWLEPTLYRQRDMRGSPWTMHGHKCAA